MSNRIKHYLNADRLRAARLAKDMTQAEAGTALLGDHCKSPAQSWNAYERGRIVHPTERTVQKMAEILGVADWTEFLKMYEVPTAAPGEVRVTMRDVEEAYTLGFNEGVRTAQVNQLAALTTHLSEDDAERN